MKFYSIIGLYRGIGPGLYHKGWERHMVLVRTFTEKNTKGSGDMGILVKGGMRWEGVWDR